MFLFCLFGWLGFFFLCVIIAPQTLNRIVLCSLYHITSDTGQIPSTFSVTTDDDDPPLKIPAESFAAKLMMHRKTHLQYGNGVGIIKEAAGTHISLMRQKDSGVTLSHKR